MRYRALSPTGDYTFGQSQNNFLINTPAAVAQAILTRLRLFRGEWFVNILAGVPYATQVLGFGTGGLYDQMIQQQIIETLGVTSIQTYSSSLNRQTRKLTITAIVNTIYGQTDPITATL